jgi:hypothetical protein
MQIKKPLPVSDVETITKKFYEHFKKEHSEFLHSIQGIADQSDRESYTSLMLNRLMFLAFIQQKGFLAGDQNYLYNRLQMVQAQYKQDPFYSFYQCFLLKLFRDGLNKRERSPALTQLLGHVPYLHSDLFALHNLERKYPAIQIPDRAFARLFTFFQAYDWHLDESPGEKRPNEINPDMLGSLFERFINQKEKGAYYTKEDVTEYISKNTIIPSIFEAVEKVCSDAFSPTGPIWSLLRSHPADYIYAGAVAEEHLGGNKPTFLHIHDLITYNLDICKFARDIIVACESSDLLLTFYECIQATTILDPTCGAGAFLFAALHILSPLYAACLTRMHAMVNEHDQLNLHGEPQKRCQTYQIERFRDILQHLGEGQRPVEGRQGSVGKGLAPFQPLRGPFRYFILKSIITKNLYGVDLMEEAVDICKLRLFLKLLAQVDKPENIEPHSAIHFNVFVGNALIGSTPAPTNPLVPQPFHWCVAFHHIMNNGGFSVIIGNPPYVEYNPATFPYTLQHFQTLACANLYPCVVERSRQLLSPQGYQGMILPLAAFATKNMIPFIEGFYNWFPRSWISFYHFRPSMLFSGGKVASIPTAIFLAQATGPEQRFSTNLIKWSTDKRDQLFSRLIYCPVTVARDRENRHYSPKLGHPIENTIMEKILRHQRVEKYLAKTPNQNTMWYRSAGGLYWKVFVNFPWPYKSTSNKQCSFQQNYARDVFIALFNSSLFWWYYTVTFDTFNLKDYMLFGFRFTYPEASSTLIHALCSCSQRLMNDFRTNAQHLKRGKTGSYTVYARKSKPIIDDIDRILARHYGFTEEELEFIINYDIKYRMGYECGGEREGKVG